MRKNRHESSASSASLGMMESWLYAATVIISQEPKPEDHRLSSALAFMTIKREWEDMAFLRRPLQSDVTVESIKYGFRLRDVDDRIVRAFDTVRGLFSDPTQHAPAKEVYAHINDTLYAQEEPVVNSAVA